MNEQTEQNEQNATQEEKPEITFTDCKVQIMVDVVLECTQDYDLSMTSPEVMAGLISALQRKIPDAIAKVAELPLGFDMKIADVKARYSVQSEDISFAANTLKILGEK